MPNEVLEVLEGPAIGRQIAIGDELIIGRGSDETGRLADDPELSRRHARISPDAEGVLTVEDMGSTNGTFVNGERISGSRRLLPGDTVKVGATVMQVLDESGRRPQPTTFSPSRASTPAEPVRHGRIDRPVPGAAAAPCNAGAAAAGRTPTAAQHRSARSAGRHTDAASRGRRGRRDRARRR